MLVVGCFGPQPRQTTPDPMPTRIASLRRLLSLHLLAALTCMAADTKPLWHIGVKDGNNAEFALAPKGYGQFAESGFFIVGQSDAKSAWPSVHPGPIDAWAGSRPHTFTVLFGVERSVPQGTCRLVLDVIDTYHILPPTLRVEVNGQAFERTLPAGASDASIFGDPAAGKPCQVVIEFPAGLLRSGNNQINLTSIAGAWFLYDCLVLETPVGVEAGGVRELTSLASAQALPGIVERGGKSYQRIAVSIVHAGGPREVAVCVGKQELQRVQLKAGQQSVEVDRKSTRLNSSHANISYAVFCL